MGKYQRSLASRYAKEDRGGKCPTPGCTRMGTTGLANPETGKVQLICWQHYEYYTSKMKDHVNFRDRYSIRGKPRDYFIKKYYPGLTNGYNRKILLSKPRVLKIADRARELKIRRLQKAVKNKIEKRGRGVKLDAIRTSQDLTQRQKTALKRNLWKKKI